MKLLLTTIAAVVLVGCGESIPLWRAARDGNIEAVRQHLASGTDVDAKTDTGYAPLQFAANYGRKEIAELLISKGADVNTKSNKGITPLHNAALGGGNQNAAHGGQKEIAELLIAKGADVNTKNELGETPLDWVLWCMQPKIADLLRKHGGKTGEELKAEGK
jgi:ankyrin repeat protein